MDVPREKASEVIEFWFGETPPHQWFAKDPAFDDLVQQRFLSLIRQAIAGELDSWSAEPCPALSRRGLRWRSPGPCIEPAGGGSFG